MVPTRLAGEDTEIMPQPRRDGITSGATFKSYTCDRGDLTVDIWVIDQYHTQLLAGITVDKRPYAYKELYD